VGLRNGTDLETSRWLVMVLEVGLRIGADLGTSRWLVGDKGYTFFFNKGYTH
jgi:hypothetical protein